MNRITLAFICSIASALMAVRANAAPPTVPWPYCNSIIYGETNDGKEIEAKGPTINGAYPAGGYVDVNVGDFRAGYSLLYPGPTNAYVQIGMFVTNAKIQYQSWANGQYLGEAMVMGTINVNPNHLKQTTCFGQILEVTVFCSQTKKIVDDYLENALKSASSDPETLTTLPNCPY
jgi:hypothetical protein